MVTISGTEKRSGTRNDNEILKKQYIASISYGKDSLAMLEIIKQNNLPLDRIITCDIYATRDIPAEYPESIEFKKKADNIIKKRYGIEVEHVRSDKSFEEVLYTKFKRGDNIGQIYGYPSRIYKWCNSLLKVQPLNKITPKDSIMYIGIAADEPQRVKKLETNQVVPLYLFNINEKEAMRICEKLDLVNPVYKNRNRGGNCWFCFNNRVAELRNIFKHYPEYWELMKKWQNDSVHKKSFSGCHTLEEYQTRFEAEEQGLVPNDNRRFRWKMLSYK